MRSVIKVGASEARITVDCNCMTSSARPIISHDVTMAYLTVSVGSQFTSWRRRGKRLANSSITSAILISMSLWKWSKDKEVRRSLPMVDLAELLCVSSHWTTSRGRGDRKMQRIWSKTVMLGNSDEAGEVVKPSGRSWSMFLLLVSPLHVPTVKFTWQAAMIGKSSLYKLQLDFRKFFQGLATKEKVLDKDLVQLSVGVCQTCLNF